MRGALLAVALLSSTFLAGLAAAVPTVDVSLSHRADPAHLLNVSTASRFVLQDAAGGTLRYRFLSDVGGAGDDQVYAGPFTVLSQPGVYDGPRVYQLRAWREGESQTSDLSFYVDDAPPTLVHGAFRVNASRASIEATDDRVGVDRVVLWRRVDAAPYAPLEMAKDADGAWSVDLPIERRGTRIDLYFQAWDRLENLATLGNATAPFASFAVANAEPSVRVTAPAPGTLVQGRFLATWEAEDVDGDTLSFSLHLRGPADRAFREIQTFESPSARSHVLDASQLPAGEHALRVVASDGSLVATDETNFVVVPRPPVIQDVRVEGDAFAGMEVVVRANVTRVGARVEARVLRPDNGTETHPMADDGLGPDQVENDGSYAARVRVVLVGPHVVGLYAQYAEDGEVKSTTLDDVARFEGVSRPFPPFGDPGEYTAMTPATPTSGSVPTPAMPWPPGLGIAALVGAALLARRASA